VHECISAHQSKPLDRVSQPAFKKVHCDITFLYRLTYQQLQCMVIIVVGVSARYVFPLLLNADDDFQIRLGFSKAKFEILCTKSSCLILLKTPADTCQEVAPSGTVTQELENLLLTNFCFLILTQKNTWRLLLMS
jgi:hypothetical protein